MVEPRLSVRSAKAHREPASTFCSRIASAYCVEIDLEAAIRGPRQVDAEL